MKFSDIPHEALETALTTAVVASAWPKFVAAIKNGEKEPNVQGIFKMSIGHYFGVAPDDHVLHVSVQLSGKEFLLEGGMHVGPGDELCRNLVSGVQHQRRVTEVGPEGTVFDTAKALASTRQARFSVQAIPMLAVVSRVLTAAELTGKREKLVEQLAQLDTGYDENVARQQASYEQGKRQLDADHARSLASLKTNFDDAKRRVQQDIAAIDAQLKSAS